MLIVFVLLILQIPSFDSKQEVVVRLRRDLDLSEAEAVGVIGWRYYVAKHDKGTLRKIKYKKFICPLPMEIIKSKVSEQKIGED